MNILPSESLLRPGQVGFGAADFDARLGGGLAHGALHEIHAAAADAASATAFALLLAWRACPKRPLLWVREERAVRRDGRPYGHGLAQLGMAPDRLLLIDAPDSVAVLRAGADIARCSGVGAVVIEPFGQARALDLTASRRLALAAARTDVMVVALRIGAEPLPSAAHSRWRVAAAPSRPLPANAPGMPAFDVTLLRHRGGVAGIEARLEWNRDRQCFDQTPLSGGLSAAAFSRTGPAVERRAA